MTQFISAMSLVVPDYDAAIDYYVNTLGFTLCEDTMLSETKRWVTIAPPGSGECGCRLLLAKAANAAQLAAIGNQAGGRVLLFLKTDRFDENYEAMVKAGVDFCETPRSEAYGKVVVFKDPFGNQWDLLEAR